MQYHILILCQEGIAKVLGIDAAQLNVCVPLNIVLVSARRRIAKPEKYETILYSLLDMGINNVPMFPRRALF